MKMEPPFVYTEAFSRNIGWVTRGEQDVLRKKRVAIAGMGGVGRSLADLGEIGNRGIQYCRS